jgi:hypothetical protein
LKRRLWWLTATPKKKQKRHTGLPSNDHRRARKSSGWSDNNKKQIKGSEVGGIQKIKKTNQNRAGRVYEKNKLKDAAVEFWSVHVPCGYTFLFLHLG